MSKISPMGPYEFPEHNLVSTTNETTGVYGPGHGCVFNLNGTDDWFFAYLEFGRRSTNRQTYVNRLEFNEDGTIKPVDLNMDGVGALRKVKTDKPLTVDNVVASSVKFPLDIKPMKNPYFRRVEYFDATFATDGANGSRWMAADDDTECWIMLDLGKKRRINRSEIAFVRPTAGHTYVLDGSTDGKMWQTIANKLTPQMKSPHVDEIGKKYRYLRVKITGGVCGVWEWNVY